MKFFKSILAVVILAFGLCFTGCANTDEVKATEVKQINTVEQEQEVKEDTKPVAFVEPEHGIIYYVDAEVVLTETIDGATTVACQDAHGERYAFFGEGFEVGDKVQLEMDDNMTENDIYDDEIIDVMIY